MCLASPLEKTRWSLVIYLKHQSNIPEMEYYCSDTGCELPETYEFIR